MAETEVCGVYGFNWRVGVSFAYWDFLEVGFTLWFSCTAFEFRFNGIKPGF
jgi:hypothetical protein